MDADRDQGSRADSVGDVQRLHFGFCKIHNKVNPSCSCGLNQYVAAVAKAAVAKAVSGDRIGILLARIRELETLPADLLLENGILRDAINRKDEEIARLTKECDEWADRHSLEVRRASLAIEREARLRAVLKEALRYLDQLHL